MNTKNIGALILFVGLAVGALAFALQLNEEESNSPKEARSKVLKSGRVDYQGNSYDIVKINPKMDDLRLFWKDEKGTPYRDFETLKASLESKGKKLLFATNAGIFSKDYSPGGLYIEEGMEIKSLNLRDGNGNFHLKPNGVFMLGTEGAGVIEASQFPQVQDSVNIATQSGPMLVIENEYHPAFNKGSSNRYVRNGVGVDKEGNIHFAISNQRVNFFAFASFFRDYLNCPNALYLDGSISEFYLPDLARYDNGGNFAGIFAIVGG